MKIAQQTRKMLIKNITSSLELVFPCACLICKKRLHGSLLCLSCQPEYPQNLLHPRCLSCFSLLNDTELKGKTCRICRRMPLPFRKLRHVWEYDGLVREIINVVKYRPSMRAALYMSDRLSRVMPALFAEEDSWDMLIPVPASRQTRYSRGFNQCICLARGVSRLEMTDSASLRLRALKHAGYRDVQASLPRTKRISNVRRAFLADRSQVAGQRILLVEDVITSGATSAAAAVELYNKGAKSVDLIALARSATWEENRAEIFESLCKGKGFSKREKYERISKINRYSEKTKRSGQRLPLGYKADT